jgi:hypothetical protein
MPRFVLIDHSLVDFSGHHFEYAQAVLNAAAQANYAPVLAANRAFNVSAQGSWEIHPAYKYGVWFHQGAPRWQVRLRTAVSSLARAGHSAGNRPAGLASPRSGTRSFFGAMQSWHDAMRVRRFVGDTQAELARIGLQSEDVVFLPTLSCAEFCALSRARRAWQLPFTGRWHFVFRRELPDEAEAMIRTIKDAFAPFAQNPSESGWHFWTDSEELAEHYQSATGCSFGVLPIPHAELPAQAPPNGPFRILCLGDARQEKGFHHLPAIARKLTSEEPRRYEFCIQSNLVIPGGEPEVVAARRALAEMSELGVRLIDGPLDSAAYRALLASGDLSLLPYDGHAYSLRSSGVFAESLAAGLTTIVPANTWMERQQPRGAGLAFRNIDEVSRLIREIAANHDRYSTAARSHASRWSRTHNAIRLVSILASSSAPSHCPLRRKHPMVLIR